MKRLIVTALICSFASMIACKKEIPQTTVVEPDFSKALNFTQSYDVKSQMLTVNVVVYDGFHAYAPGEKTGRPVSLNVKATNGWKLVGVPQIPQGKEKTLASLGKSRVLEGNFVVKGQVIGGKGPIDGELDIQVCTENFCDRPRTHPFLVNVVNEPSP